LRSATGKITLNGTLDSEREMVRKGRLNRPDSVHCVKKRVESKHRWYYVDVTQSRYGPVNSDKLRELWHNGKLDRRCVVWNMDDSSFDTWRMVSAVPVKYMSLFPKQTEATEDFDKEAIWHYLDRKTSKSVGPYSVRRLRDLHWDGKIEVGDLVWNSETMTDWISLDKTKEYAGYFKRPKPLPVITSKTPRAKDDSKNLAMPRRRRAET
jgi:hypothetical protein